MHGDEVVWQYRCDTCNIMRMVKQSQLCYHAIHNLVRVNATLAAQL